MNKTVLLAGAAIIGLSLFGGPATAQTAPSGGTAAKPAQTDAGQKPPAMTDAEKLEYKGMLKDASTMMGHVGIANIALLHDLTDEAKDNVQKALTIARALEIKTDKLNADAIKVGRIKFHTSSGDTHDYWLPIENDSFIVSDMDMGYMLSKNPKMAVADAQMVNTKVTLDVKQVRDSLEKAATAISIKNYGDAQVALFGAVQSTFTDETVSNLPLVTVHDNLVLARELAKTKDYDGATFALNHAKDALTEYQKTATGDKATQSKKLQAEISALQAEIAKDRGSIVANLEKHLSAWLHDVEALMP